MIKVTVYRLWSDNKYDLIEVDIPFVFDKIFLDDLHSNVELIESIAISKAWLNLVIEGLSKKPIQIGLLMSSLDKLEGNWKVALRDSRETKLIANAIEDTMYD